MIGVLIILGLVGAVAFAGAGPSSFTGGGWATDPNCSTLKLVNPEKAMQSAIGFTEEQGFGPVETKDEFEARLRSYFGSLFVQCETKKPSRVVEVGRETSWDVYVQQSWEATQAASGSFSVSSATGVALQIGKPGSLRNLLTSEREATT